MAADTIVTGSKLAAIADAVREKTGTQGTYTLDQMATAIGAITGSDHLTNRITKKSSSLTYDVAATDIAGELAPLAFYYDENLRDVTFPAGLAQYIVYANTFSYSGLRNITFPARTALPERWRISNSFPTGVGIIFGSSQVSPGGMFQGCKSLVAADLSNVDIDEYAAKFMFAYCSSLESVTLPENAGEEKNAIGASMFTLCSSLEEVVFPGGWYGCLSGGQSFAYSGVKVVDLGEDFREIDTGTGQYDGLFLSCSSLLRVILRRTSGVVELASPYLFGTTSGYVPYDFEGIYVPDDLVASYQAADNWASFSAHIKPISDLG